MASKAEIRNDYRKLMRSTNPPYEVGSLKSSLEELLGEASNETDKSYVLMQCGMHSHIEGRIDEAFERFEKAFQLGRSTQALINTLVCSRKIPAGSKTSALQKMAVVHVEKLEDSTEKAEVYDALCHNAGNQKKFSTAGRFGRESLRIKDAIQPIGKPLIDRPRPQFNYEDRSRNVISFSLYGDKERYVRVAIENAKAVQYVYPGWSCRFTVDQSVPVPVLDQLSSHGAQIRISPDLHDPALNTGLFWRFTVASDPGVDFFLVRDADSLINVREKVAVDEWIASDRDFHVMRDFYSHSELILAGLWGGVAGRIPNIVGQINQWHKDWPSDQLGVHNHDQLFLRKHIWPTIKSSLMQHDSAFRAEGTRNFPSVGVMQPVRHVGQDMGIFLNR